MSLLLLLLQDEAETALLHESDSWATVQKQVLIGAGLAGVAAAAKRREGKIEYDDRFFLFLFFLRTREKEWAVTDIRRNKRSQ